MHERLVVWDFTFKFPNMLEAKSNWFQVLHMYRIIESDPYLQEMLTLILGIGNVLNGGTNKGQADGFMLNAISKVDEFKGKE
jgi:hypothetical protein